MPRSTLTSRSIIVMVGLLLVALGTGAAPAPGWRAKVSNELLGVYKSAAAAVATAPTGSAFVATPSALGPRYDAAGRVQVDVLINCAMKVPTAALTSAGLRGQVSIHVPPMCIVEGWVAPAGLAGIASVAGVQKVKTPAYSTRSPPRQFPRTKKTAAATTSMLTQGANTIDGNAVAIMRADQFVALTGVTGAGVTIGVMSDNVTNLALIQSRGELPAVQVLPSSAGGTPSTNPGDEGTMMLEEVHAVAPGATLAFCAPSGTSAQYVGCLQQLIGAGATVVVDDLAFASEDMMSTASTFATAVENLLTANAKVVLFTVTENYNGSYWEGTYVPVSLASLGYSALSCPISGAGSQTDYYLNSFNGVAGETLTVNVAGTYPLTMQWADPFDANVSNFDLYWINSLTNATGCASSTGLSATAFGPTATLAVGTYYIFLATPDTSLTGKFIKLWIGGDGVTTLTPSANGSVVSPQAFAAGALTIGAVNGSDGLGDTIESYSGRGPIRLAFPTPSTIPAPFAVAPDGIYVDTAGTVFPAGLFYGTSAAAPNAAAVAALLRSAFPVLTPVQVTTALQTGAMQLGATVPDSTFGYGRVDAINTLGAIPYPTMSGFPNQNIAGGTSSPAATFTVGGVGPLQFAIQSTNTSLLPNALVAAGTAGVTITPANCGQGATACTISFTPTLGQTGTANVKVIDIDGAARQSSITALITVTKPAPPTVTVTSNGSQSFTVGGTASTVGITLAGTGPLVVSPTSSNTSLVPANNIGLTGNCGTAAVMTCSSAVTVAPGATGSATITYTATDPYGQTGTATATVQVNAAPASGGGGGGGAFDFLTLVALAGLGLLRRRD